MNTEREKTDALSDAVEIDNNKPDGATHYRKMFIFLQQYNNLLQTPIR